MLIIKENIELYKERNIPHENVKKTYQIISNDNDFFRP